MDRTEFFKMAQKVAVYTKECRDLNKNLLEECIVSYNEIKYYPQYVKVGYDADGNVKNIAVLHDLKTNCIMECDLKRVSKVEKI